MSILEKNSVVPARGIRVAGETLVRTLGDDILQGTNGDDTLDGGEGNDRLYGYGGDDDLIGGAGNDYLRGYAGADINNGGEGIDTVSYYGSTVGVIVNLDDETASGGYAEGDTLINIESVLGSNNHADILIGSTDDNTLSGAGGNDRLYGYGGDDDLRGGDGDDYLRGYDGADINNGGAGIDTVSYFGSTAGVTVNLSTQSASGGHADGDTLISIESVLGSNGHADILIGSNDANTLSGAGGNDRLYGYGGDDNLIGGAGNDYLRGYSGADINNGGAGIDTVSYYGSTAGVVINLDDETASGGYAEGDTLISIESILGSNNHADILIGSTDTNTLSGAGGNDRLYGYGGDDDLRGGDGDDYLRGYDGADINNGGSGIDTVSYYGSTAGVVVNLDDETASGGYAEGDTLISIESVLGSRYYGDQLIGNDEANALYGSGGDDLLFGGAGADILEGGADNDFLAGDSGSDTFIFKDNFGSDTIVGFEDGVDKLSFIGHSQIDEFSDLTLSQQGSDTLISDGANEVILTEILETTIDASDFIFM